VAQGGLASSAAVVRYQTLASDDGETIESSGVLTINQSNQDQVLYCQGSNAAWNASGSSVDFVQIGSVTAGGG
jgi:hypothetical protein